MKGKYIKQAGILFTVILFLSLNSTSFSKTTEDKVKEAFLVASTGNIKYYPKRPKAIKQLVKYGDESVKLLLSEMDAKNIRKQNTLITVFSRIGEEAVEPILRKMAVDEDNAVLGAYILGRIKSSKALVPLLMMLRDSDPDIRAAAARGLGGIQDSISVDPLIEKLSDPDPRVRRYSAVSLGKLRDKKAVDELIMAMSDSNFSVRYAASYALARIGGNDLKDKLVEKLNETEGIFKYHIIETLGSMNHRDTKPIFYELLENPSYEIRGYACEALGNFRGDYKVANALKRALHDESEFVKMKARNSLEKLRG
ncbi:HEAT repeat domain-containing protein [bacterium]|nr:HEAT repeat domain-containing protein [bacterium]